MKRLVCVLLAIVALSGSLILSSCGKDDTNIPVVTDERQSEQVEGEPEKEVVMLPADELKVVSINVYLNNPTPRAKGLISIIRDLDPDSIGVQEFMGGWVDEFDGKMSDYAHAGFAHDAKEVSRYVYANYIFYKKDKYDLIDHGILWLSETPSTPSSLNGSDIAIERRTCCWALLENKETGFRYVHVNCHLESGSEEERLIQAPIVRDLILRFEALGYPVFATGDYNAREGSAPYEIFEAEDKIDDPKYIAEDTMDMGTYNGFGDSDYKNSKPIDFCFVTGDKMAVHEYKVVPTEYDDEYVSDHNAVFVRATVNSLEKQTDILPDYLTTDGITYEITSVRPYVAEFTFTQADDIFHTDTYRVWAEDKDGNEVVVRTIPSKNIDKNSPAILTCTLAGLSADSEYTVFIAPATMTGTYNNRISFTVKTPANQ